MSVLMNNTMLIIDDAEMDREVLNLLFAKDFTILEADSGEEAMELLEGCSGNIDIVLLDLMMPGLDGFDVLKRRQELSFFKNVPTVVITASDNVDDQIKAFSLGASDYIVKPFIPEIVVSRIMNVLGSNRRMASIMNEKEELKLKAEMDQMTGLYNKTTAQKNINDFLLSSREGLHAMLVIDIDNFKQVNDTEGHLVGDHTIRIVADLIANQFRQNDIVGRIGGDEFVVLMRNVPSKELARRKVHELVHLMKYKPNITLPANCSVSIGFAFSERQLISYDELFSMADKALYNAKHLGKARCCEFGVAVEVTTEEKASVLLYSNNRDVCCAFATVTDYGVGLVDFNSREALEAQASGLRDKAKAVVVDISEGHGSAKWSVLEQQEWLAGVPVMAVCREGDLNQLKEALLHDAKDIFMTPLDVESVKRRMVKFLELDPEAML